MRFIALVCASSLLLLATAPTFAQYLNMAAVYSDKRVEAAINNYLDLVLESVPSASQVRVGLIHKRIENSSSSEFLFDVAFVRTRPHFIQSQRLTDLPLTQWRTYLNKLADNSCAVITLDQIDDQNVKERLAGLRITVYQGCPLWRDNRYLLGAVFTFWSDTVPTDQDLMTSEKALRHVSPRIVKQLVSAL
jgi:hypothetical protein